MEDSFEPGQTVIHKDAKNRSEHGEVMDIPISQQKIGYTPVYKNRQVWIKTENLILLSEWIKRHNPRPMQVQGPLRDYWTGSGQ